jgi:HSP20 family protein
MSRREVEEWFWQVGGDLHRLHEEMNRFRPSMAASKMWEPRVDVLEDDHRFIIKAEIAGVSGEDIQLNYIQDRHSILIRGIRREDNYGEGERTKFHQLEIFYGPFEREVKLPEVPIRSDEIRAHYRGGFLLIAVPKEDRITRTTTTITIKKI